MATAKDYFRRLRGLRAAFRATFLMPDGKPHADAQIVLDELKRFCYGAKPTIKMANGVIDPYASVAAAARQEVYMRIAAVLNADDRDIKLMEQAQETDNG